MQIASIRKAPIMRQGLRASQWDALIAQAYTVAERRLPALIELPVTLDAEKPTLRWVELGLIDMINSREIRGASNVELHFGMRFSHGNRNFARVGYEITATVTLLGEINNFLIDPGGDMLECMLEDVSAGGDTSRCVLARFDRDDVDPNLALARMIHPFEPIRMASLAALEWLVKENQLSAELQQKAITRLSATLRAAQPDTDRRKSNKLMQARALPVESPAASAAMFIAGVLGAVQRGEIPGKAARTLQEIIFEALFEAYKAGSSTQAEMVIDLERFNYMIRDRRDFRTRMVLRAFSAFRDERVQEFAKANR